MQFCKDSNMRSILDERVRSPSLKARQLFLCLVFLGAAACRAQLREHERRLTELDKEYLAPEAPISNARRQKCAGIEQMAPLKGEWVRSLYQSSTIGVNLQIRSS